MTTTAWTTSATIPPSMWAATVADVQALLGVSANAGAAVTGPDGVGEPVLDFETIAFTVQAAQAGAAPLTVQFTRQPGTGSVVTNAPTTGGLVCAALKRAERYWGPLLTWNTEADTRAQAVCVGLVEALFGAGDRAVAGVDRPGSDQGRAQEIVAAALGRVFAADPNHARNLVGYLDALVAELQAERAGAATALLMTAPVAPPVTPPAP